jgi:hypothetical protein
MKEHNFKECKVLECEECQRLISEDLILVCDFCDAVGDKNAIGAWLFVEMEKIDNFEIGKIACLHCATPN